MAKITPRKSDSTVVVRTKNTPQARGMKWWKAESEIKRSEELVSTISYLKENQAYRHRQAAMYARLYSNQPLFGMVGGSLARMSGQGNALPVDRPTMNVIQSCVDTLVSRITQSRPRPIFLTDNGDYKMRRLAKQLNQFIVGELYQTGAYQMGEVLLRDAAVLGSGCVKVFRQGDRVALERVLVTELYVDQVDAMYGTPRSLYQLKLIDRGVLAECFDKKKSVVEKAEQGYPDDSSESSKSVSDLVMVVEGWHLPSGEGAGDGKHVIACSSGSLLDEKFDKDCFPFVFLPYSPRMLGLWGQPLTEQLMGTQMEINKLLMTITASINLVGVPRVFVNNGSKIVKAHLNNQIGSIVTYSGEKPSYEIAPCVPAEIYGQLQRLVDYAYQQSGISALAASSKKPDGLNSGVAIREYDDLQSDRFASLNKRYDQMYVDLAYLMIDCAQDIVKETGSYQTVYPNKDGTREIDLPGAEALDDTFVIQCFDASALPRDPAGRLAKITEMIQAGMISIQEGRRLLNYPDLEQNEKLVNAGEERILKILDQIVEDGDYTPPDPYMPLDKAIELSNQYYNLYIAAQLEEDRAEMLRTFNTQAQAFQQSAQSAIQPPQAPGQPQLASPEPVPTSPMMPQGQTA